MCTFGFPLRREALISSASCQKNKIIVTGLGGRKKSSINDQECQPVTRRFGIVGMLLGKQIGWPTSAQYPPSVRTVE